MHGGSYSEPEPANHQQLIGDLAQIDYAAAEQALLQMMGILREDAEGIIAKKKVVKRKTPAKKKKVIKRKLKLESKLWRVGPIQLPEFFPDKVYMQQFTTFGDLSEIHGRYRDTVRQMLSHLPNLPANHQSYFMVDASVVQKGTHHRREGLHIEGYWNPDDERPVKHRWSEINFNQHELTLFAATHTGCAGYEGEFIWTEQPGGACKGVKKAGMKRTVMKPNTVYAGNVTMLHESLPQEEYAERTFIRITVPGVAAPVVRKQSRRKLNMRGRRRRI